MKQLFLIMVMVSLTACAGTTERVRTHESPRLYNADCMIKGQQFSEGNLLLLEESDSAFKARAGDGKTLSLPTTDCILSQVPREEGFAENRPGQYWTKCQLGKMSLVTDGLIFEDDVKNYIRFRRRDGQIWVLPRVHCAIFKMKLEN